MIKTTREAKEASSRVFDMFQCRQSGEKVQFYLNMKVCHGFAETLIISVLQLGGDNNFSNMNVLRFRTSCHEYIMLGNFKKDLLRHAHLHVRNHFFFLQTQSSYRTSQFSPYSETRKVDRFDSISSDIQWMGKSHQFHDVVKKRFTVSIVFNFVFDFNLSLFRHRKRS